MRKPQKNLADRLMMFGFSEAVLLAPYRSVQVPEKPAKEEVGKRKKTPKGRGGRRSTKNQAPSNAFCKLFNGKHSDPDVNAVWPRGNPRNVSEEPEESVVVATTEKVVEEKKVMEIQKTPKKVKKIEEPSPPSSGETRKSGRARRPNTHFSPGKADNGRKRKTSGGSINGNKTVAKKLKCDESLVTPCVENVNGNDSPPEIAVMEEETEESEDSSTDYNSEDDYKPTKRTRKSNNVVTRAPSKRANSKDKTVIPTNDEEVLSKIASGLIPETLLYRAGSNSMYIPSINADMINGNGSNMTIQASSKNYFKYVRVHQKTKSDHADPQMVREIIDAVRRRPIIWDQRLVSHQEASLIRRAWQQIDVELGANDAYPLTRRRQIWKNKKDYFSYAVQTNSLNKWTYASNMEFYRPMVNFRSTVCMRPTVAPQPEQLVDNYVLGNKQVNITSDDKVHFMTFLIKTINDVNTANYDMMIKYQNNILDIFEKNFNNLSLKYSE